MPTPAVIAAFVDAVNAGNTEAFLAGRFMVNPVPELTHRLRVSKRTRIGIR